MGAAAWAQQYLAPQVDDELKAVTDGRTLQILLSMPVKVLVSPGYYASHAVSGSVLESLLQEGVEDNLSREIAVFLQSVVKLEQGNNTHYVQAGRGPRWGIHS